MTADSECPPDDDVSVQAGSTAGHRRDGNLWFSGPIANDNEFTQRDSFISFPAGDKERVVPDEAPIGTSELSLLEWTVIELAMTDDLVSVTEESAPAQMSSDFFGIRRANPLANPRLEALRRFVVKSHLGAPDDPDEYD